MRTWLNIYLNAYIFFCRPLPRKKAAPVREKKNRLYRVNHNMPTPTLIPTIANYTKGWGISRLSLKEIEDKAANGKATLSEYLKPDAMIYTASTREKTWFWFWSPSGKLSR